MMMLTIIVAASAAHPSGGCAAEISKLCGSSSSSSSSSCMACVAKHKKKLESKKNHCSDEDERTFCAGTRSKIVSVSIGARVGTTSPSFVAHGWEPYTATSSFVHFKEQAYKNAV